MARLDRRSAIVTGGALGIGGGTARRLAADGAKVLIVDIEQAAAKRNADRIKRAGGTAAWMTGDVSQEAVAKQMVEKAMDEFGRLDILVQNAYGGGADRGGSAVEVSPKAWREGMDLLVGALFLGAKYAVPAMERSGPPPGAKSAWMPGKRQLKPGEPPGATRGGRIVNITSVHGILMAAKSLVYEAGKAAVIGLTREMAIDFGPLGITVNTIAPGHIVTERGQQMWAERGNEEGFHLFELQYPVRRCGTPEDIAGAISFLCSDDASFITGVVLPVDGGLSIQLQENIVMELQEYMQSHRKLKTHFSARPALRT
jgi:NAD(P)-dependent dehydrogenase (short-subunit alcohol dehydrogenase family)